MTEQAKTSVPFYLRKRCLIVFLVFFGYFNIFTNNVNLSVAIIAMTENHTIHSEDGSLKFEQDFDWDSKEKGLALSSYFYGYLTTQILGGVLAAKYGGHLIFNLGIFGTGLFSLLIPYMTRFGIGWLVAARIIVGIFSGLAFTSAYDVLTKWIPPAERSRSVSFTMSGINIGTFTVNFASGYITVGCGWKWIFYIFGIIAILWSFVWFLIAHRSPEVDPWITEAERKYIIESLKEEHGQEAAKTPWIAIAKSFPVYAIFVADISFSWGYFTLVTQLPQYMEDVLDFSLQRSAVVSSFPYLVYTFFAFFSGYLADWFLMKKYLTVTQVRKYFNNFSFICQMVFLLVVAFVTNSTVIVVCIILSIGLGAFAASGYLANPLDIASQYSSIIYGISSTFSVLTGVISPSVTGHIVTTPSTSEYQVIFLIACGIYLFGTVFYGIFASGDIQPWASAETSEDMA